MTPWTAAFQAPLFMGFSRQEYCGVPSSDAADGDVKRFSLWKTGGQFLLMGKCGEGNGNPLQYSCLENPMNRGAWKAAVHSVAEGQMTERLYFYFSLSCMGEGNGSPLQCSCLENPWDGGAWWAAVCGVTHSRTRLK